MERRLAAIMAADMVGWSRLMEADADDVVTRQKTHRRQLIDPEIERRRGRIVKTTGDGMLVEFTAVQDAVRCAREIQGEMAAREAETDADRRIEYRVGVNLGDVIHDDNDIFGDGVNVAARLEGIAEPGGVAVSDIVHQLLSEQDADGFRDMGSQRVKNISRPIRVWQWTPSRRESFPEPTIALSQKVRFAVSADGTHIAWAEIGQGPPLLKAPNWLNHLEYEWRSPLWAPTFERLAEGHRFVRFDQRGNGLSDREPENVSLERFVEDIGAVADAAGLERFPIFAISQGCASSIRFAAENPDRVSAMVLLGGFLRGRLKRDSAVAVAKYEASRNMILGFWGSTNSAAVRFFTSSYMPDASASILDSFDELQRVSANPEEAARLLQANAELDVDEWAPQVKCPTLVLHTRSDQIVPIEEGRRIAAMVPDARFIELPGANHVVAPGSEAFDRLFEEMDPFLAEHG